MERALSIPEILDQILREAVPSAQATAAQTCQRWSEHSLQLLWKSLPSIFPHLQLLSPLVCRSGDWHFETDLSGVDWKRFNRYAGYTRSLVYDDRDAYQGYEGLPLAHLVFEEVHRHRPPSDGPIFPNLNDLEWVASQPASLAHVTLLLTPTITSLNLSCASPILTDACTELLRTLGPRQIFLSRLKLALVRYDEAFLRRLPPILSHQTRLVSVSLPPYSATPDVVAALGRLPQLKEYGMWSWSSHQTSLDLGQAFTWAEGSFLSLETLSFITSLADAGEVMGKGHQSRLRSLRIVCRTPAQYPQLQSLSSKLSAAPLHLTSIALFIYSQDFVAKTSGGLPFDCIHPLLHCTTLYSLLLGHNMPIMYSEDDIMTMGKAWPAMEALMLCADPVDTVGYSLGRPLRSIGVFADHFPHLTLLGIYVNTFEIPSDSQEHTRFRVLGVLDIGTSPDAAEVHLPLSVYLGKVLTAKTVLKSGRSVEHTRALPKTPASTTEYARRAASWASLASDLRAVQASNLATGVQALAAEDDSLLKEL